MDMEQSVAVTAQKVIALVNEHFGTEIPKTAILGISTTKGEIKLVIKWSLPKPKSAPRAK